MKIFYSLSIILLVSLQAISQERTPTNPAQQPTTKIRFYPNPATSIITFDFQGGYDKSYNFQIINFLGKKVYEANNIAPRTVVDLSDFFRGVYIYQVKNKMGKIIDSGKFQVSK